MVLILDRAISTRAERLRDAIIDMHIPAAFTSIAKGRELLPAFFIITFADVVDEIRRMICYEDVPVVVYGGGLVHQALGVLQIAEYDALLSYIRAEAVRLLQQRGMVRDGNIGCFLPNGIYLTAVGAFFRNTPLYLSGRECEILRYLVYAQMLDPEWYVPARHICLPAKAYLQHQYGQCPDRQSQRQGDPEYGFQSHRAAQTRGRISIRATAANDEKGIRKVVSGQGYGAVYIGGSGYGCAANG